MKIFSRTLTYGYNTKACGVSNTSVAIRIRIRGSGVQNPVPGDPELFSPCPFPPLLMFSSALFLQSIFIFQPWLQGFALKRIKESLPSNKYLIQAKNNISMLSV